VSKQAHRATAWHGPVVCAGVWLKTDKLDQPIVQDFHFLNVNLLPHEIVSALLVADFKRLRDGGALQQWFV